MTGFFIYATLYINVYNSKGVIMAKPKTNIDKTKKLKTAKREMFCQEYLIDLNATQASIRAGYSVNTARSIGNKLLTKDDINNRISYLKSIRVESITLDAKYVLNRLHQIDCLDVIDIIDDSGRLKAIKDWPKSWRISISGLDVNEIMTGDIEAVVKKIKWPDKLKNLELLGRHIDVRAWEKDMSSDDTPISKIQIEVIGANSNN